MWEINIIYSAFVLSYRICRSSPWHKQEEYVGSRCTSATKKIIGKQEKVLLCIMNGSKSVQITYTSVNVNMDHDWITEHRHHRLYMYNITEMNLIYFYTEPSYSHFIFHSVIAIYIIILPQLPQVNCSLHPYTVSNHGYDRAEYYVTIQIVYDCCIAIMKNLWSYITSCDGAK